MIISDGDTYLWRTWFYIIFIKHFLSVIKINKTFVFFLRTSGKYSKKYRQGSVFTTDPWKRILKTDPCPYLVKYSLDVLKKKTKFYIFLIRTKSIYQKKYRIKSSRDMDRDPFSWYKRIPITDFNYFNSYNCSSEILKQKEFKLLQNYPRKKSIKEKSIMIISYYNIHKSLNS